MPVRDVTYCETSGIEDLVPTHPGNPLGPWTCVLLPGHDTRPGHYRCPNPIQAAVLRVNCSLHVSLAMSSGESPFQVQWLVESRPWTTPNSPSFPHQPAGATLPTGTTSSPETAAARAQHLQEDRREPDPKRGQRFVLCFQIKTILTQLGEVRCCLFLFF